MPSPDRRIAAMPTGAAAAAGPESHAGDPNFMASLARGLQVIRAFSEFRRNLTISQVSQATGIPRAAARRCLYTLKALGYVDEVDRRFTLRPQVLTLGHAYLSSTPLAVVAQPYLDDVSRRVQESCSAAILDGDDIVYICRSAEKRILSISLLVGTRLPAYCTALGQVLLAHLPAEQLETLSRARQAGRPHRQHDHHGAQAAQGDRTGPEGRLRDARSGARGRPALDRRSGSRFARHGGRGDQRRHALVAVLARRAGVALPAAAASVRRRADPDAARLTGRAPARAVRQRRVTSQTAATAARSPSR